VQFFTKSQRFVVLLGEGGSPADKSYVLVQELSSTTGTWGHPLLA